MAQVGLPAPEFKLPSTKNATSSRDLGFEVSLDDYDGKWLVFFFYPLDFTFLCATQILALSDRYDEFTAVGADVLGASTDSVHSHFAWIDTPRDKNGIANLRFPLVADYKKEIARVRRARRSLRRRAAGTLHHRSGRHLALYDDHSRQRRTQRR